ncbi:MAG: flavodoxin-dependent (E)-4-hydroxy-3-methylbut-2-enyl-diphosphate synthase [Armatimonadota bacterium]
MLERRKTKSVNVGGVILGGGAPVSVQSMTTTDTRDAAATIEQIHKLGDAGCDIVRVAVPDKEAASALSAIKKGIKIPLVADIHFDYRLALLALEAGVDKLRINPGNIGSSERVEIVAKAAKERGVPIRIGANVGSIDKNRYGQPTAETLAQSALDQVKILEDLDFTDIVISLKAFDVPMSAGAYRIVSETVPYPLHLGITEAGLPWEGTIRSAVGIGAMLAEGIGDTLRVSLTGDPVEEVSVGIEILSALNLRKKPYTIVSCPTCGRCDINLADIASEVRRRLAENPPSRPLKIAVMGCTVNGPGEASMADVGIAGGAGVGLLFSRGKILRRVDENQLVDELMKEIEGLERNT